MRHGSIVRVLNLLLALLTLGVVGVFGALLAGFLGGGGLAAEQSTVPVRALPPGPLTGSDVEELRFAAALRGYRMDQVDAAIDRLAAELERLRSELAAVEPRRADRGFEPRRADRAVEPDEGR